MCTQKARGRHHVSCFIALHLIPLRKDLSLSLDIRLIANNFCDSPVSTPTALEGLQLFVPAVSGLFFMWVLGIQTWMLMHLLSLPTEPSA